MNERIKKLMSQTALHRNDHTTEQRLAEVEKFAELVVRECAAQADEESSWPYSSFGKKIKEHFGVEE